MSKKFIRSLILVFVTLVLIIPSSVIGKGTDEPTSESSENNNAEGEAPVFKNVSVHDPSIIKDGDTYYVFGTHIEAARSKDLMSWTRFTNGYTTPGNALYGDLSANLAESFAWAGENDSDSKGGFAVWAPEIFWNEHYINGDGTTGAYLMYYSASSTYIRSAIGYAVSKNIEGPYSYVDTIVYSGFTRDAAYDANSFVNKKWDNTNIKQLIDNGELTGTRAGWFNNNGSYNNGTFPNAIDANLFFDETGKLWMTYGSWSGGIFILEIDKTTGKAIYPTKDGTTSDGRLVDRYFGTKISGGFGKSGEGPYVIYDKNTGYYYLYVTYGWLAADGEYNMRAFRSTNPAGPYVDAMGQNAVLPENVDHSLYGNKIMGHFLFERNVGDPGTGIGYGYVSSGHNSVYYDEETGQRFLAFHTRFPQRGETHELRIHQLFINKDGWPVAAPYRYSGEKIGKVNRQDLIGDYQFINHGKDISKNIKKATTITLNEDGTISGLNGSWELTDDYDATLTVDGKTYKGVFLRQWNSITDSYGMTFTALSDEGVSIWGIKTINRTDGQIVEIIKNELNLGDTNAVIANLSLPTEGARGTQISWHSSNPDVVSEQGVVSRPAAGSKNATVSLTATITKGNATAERTFTIIVLAENDAKLVAHYSFEGDLTDGTKNVGAGTVTGDRIDNTGGTISYTSGKSGQAAVFDGQSGICLPNGLISSNKYSVSLWLNPKQLTDFTTTFFGARTNESWVSLVPKGPVGSETMVWSGSNWFDANTGLQIPVNEWTHVAFTVDEGKINVYVNGMNKFSRAGFPNVFTSTNSAFALGVNYWDLPYKGLMDELLIYDGIALSEQEIQTYYETGQIPGAEEINEETNLDMVKDLVQQHVTNPGIRNSLLVQLENAQKQFDKTENFLKQGKEKQAEQSEANGYKTLEQITERIEQHSGKHIDKEHANQLISLLGLIVEKTKE